MRFNVIVNLFLITILCSVSALDVSPTFKFVKKPKVLVTHRNIPSRGVELLKETCDVIMPESVPPRREEILKLARGVDGMLWGNHELIDAEVLDAAGPNLKAISLYSVGYDYVDLPEIKRRKVPFGHTPDVPSKAVADIAIGLMIAAGRHFYDGRLRMETNRWVSDPQFLLGKDIDNSTVGIIGLGRIGGEIAQRLRGFDVNQILYSGHKPKSDAERRSKAKFASLTDILEKSDFIIIAAPLTHETRNMFNATTFDKMKPQSVLVNIARGQIVNTNDLVHALKTGKLYAAGLDVMDPEPLPENHELYSLPNVVLTPHLGSATYETRSEMSVLAAQNVLRGMSGLRMVAPVP